MTKPVIMAVDDDPTVLSAVERDLRRKYAKDYQLVRADSGAVALQTLEQLKLRGANIALLLVDQRMPQMTGVEFLTEALKLYPDAKRVLLTAYADTEAAIRAINEIRLDYYLMKPWDPPEDHLYPVLDDVLYDWMAQFRPTYEGIRVIGHRWSAMTHQVKDFLSRNQVPYHWLDLEIDPEARRLAETARPEGARLPLLVFPDGTALEQPTNSEVAEKVGLRVHAGLPFYDLIIVGAGPAGLAAAVYGASEGLRTLLLEREAPGGQAGTSSRIENYLGFPAGLSGGDLARRAVAQAARFGAEILTPQEVCSLRIVDPYRYVSLADGTEVTCHALVIATGVSYRKLVAPGVEELTGIGIYYGAAQTEAVLYKGEDVYVAGGANSAGQAAMHLAKYARSVTILVRGDSIAKGMSAYLVDQINSTDNIRVVLNSTVKEARGTTRLESLVLEDTVTHEEQEAPASALFIFIGQSPRTDWVSGVLERDDMGFILTGPDTAKTGKLPESWTLKRSPYWLETSVPGVFACGDVRHRSVKRMASAVGEGAMAVQFIHQYLSSL